MAPTSFGRYEIVRRLDGGGMGEVYLARARGAERVQKTVVLKRLRPDRADEAARARFVEEARIAVSLSHPHIVPVFELGERDGEYFLAMEWLRGGNLSGIAGPERAPLGWAAVALIGSQICDALAYVHARRNRQGAALVHGDVSPRNLLLSTDGHVLLADFGLARFAARGRSGTLRYLAPEQARGEEIDGRADLYSLAIILCEAATGRRAYDADPQVAARQALTGIMPELDGCDEELERVLRRALAPHAGGRYREALAMREAFDALFDRPGREPRARAKARAELIARVAQAQSGAGADSRAELSALATRDATAPPAPRRRRRLALAALLAASAIVGVGAVAGLGTRLRGRSSSASPVPRPASASALDGIRAAVPTPLVPDRAIIATALQPGGARSVEARDRRGHAHAPHASAQPPRATPAPSSLDVNATPWARVRIDGENRGETPLLDLALSAGTHRLELVNEPLGVRRELTLTVRPGEHVRRIVDLTSP